MKEAISTIVENQNGDFLLHLRDGNASALKNQWCLVCGAVDPGEKPIETVKREIEEETSLKPESVKFVKNITFRDTLFSIYHATINGSFNDLKLGEGLEFKLENKDDTIDFLTTLEYTNPFLDLLKDFLKNR
ncbi:NUDIX domain-containing protein [Patescibacteria group bacterium]